MPRVPRSAAAKGLLALAHCVQHPRSTLHAFQRGLATAYRDRVAGRSPIPTVALAELLGDDLTVSLSACAPRDGNVSLEELLAICALARRHRPRVALEIGTFDGNTTLQLALNAAEDATVITLDLPPDAAAASRELEPADRAYIEDPGKQVARRYQRHPAGERVVQYLGDSATFDFLACAARHGRPQLAFIDGSHSYAYVRSDSERVLEVMADDGVVVWHDYTPAWPGVIAWLDALAARLPLRRVAGTSLVFARLGGT